MKREDRRIEALVYGIEGIPYSFEIKLIKLI